MSYFPESLYLRLPPINSDFVKNTNGIFTVGDRRMRFMGVNKFEMGINGMSSAAIDTYLDDSQRLSIPVVRTWAFADQGFFDLFYPIGTNLITTNAGFETGDFTDWTASADGGFNWEISTDTSQAGTYSAKLDATGGYTGLGRAVTVTAHTDYLLDFYHKTTNRGGLPARVIVGTALDDNSIKDGGYINDTSGLWARQQVQFNSGASTTVWFTFQNFGGSVLGYIDTVNVSAQSGAPALVVNEAMMRTLDLAIYKAGLNGTRLWLSLMDGNFFNYNSKAWYISKANTINGTSLSADQHSTDFFTQTGPQNIFKLWIDTLTDRTNFYNGIVNKNNPAIFCFELGNELRAEASEGADVNTLGSSNLAILTNGGGWIDRMSTYFKTKDPNHMVCFGDSSHGWDYRNGDTIWNGTYYGVDYGIESTLPNIDFIAVHMYINHGDNVHLQEYGQYLGYPNAVSKEGLIAQIRHIISTAKANGKPAVLAETGFLRETIGDNTYFPLYPRANAFAELANIWFEAGGDAMLIWTGEVGDAPNSYPVNLSGWDNNTTNLNYNDLPIQDMITRVNTLLSQERI